MLEPNQLKHLNSVLILLVEVLILPTNIKLDRKKSGTNSGLKKLWLTLPEWKWRRKNRFKQWHTMPTRWHPFLGLVSISLLGGPLAEHFGRFHTQKLGQTSVYSTKDESMTRRHIFLGAESIGQ